MENSLTNILQANGAATSLFAAMYKESGPENENDRKQKNLIIPVVVSVRVKDDCVDYIAPIPVLTAQGLCKI